MIKKLVLFILVMLLSLQVVFAADEKKEYLEKDLKCDKVMNTCTDLKGNKISGDAIVLDKKAKQTYIRQYVDGVVENTIKTYDNKGKMLPHNTPFEEIAILVIAKMFPNGNIHMQAEIKFDEQKATNIMFRENGSKHLEIVVIGDNVTGTCYLSDGKTRPLTAEETEASKSSPYAIECK